MLDYVKTAKAIAENIGILPHGSPADTAVDCDTIRVSPVLLIFSFWCV